MHGKWVFLFFSFGYPSLVFFFRGFAFPNLNRGLLFCFLFFFLLDLDLVGQPTPTWPARDRWSFEIDRPAHILGIKWTAEDSDPVCIV